MAKFQMNVLVGDLGEQTARLADGTGSANQLTKADNEKFVKLVGDSQYGLSAAGDDIEAAVVVADSIAPQDGYNLGTIQTRGRKLVVLDGLQSTPGTGTVAVKDIVVTGTVVARGTALSTYPKVCKATTPANVVFKWRVVAILSGSGAPGSVAVIERV